MILAILAILVVCTTCACVPIHTLPGLPGASPPVATRQADLRVGTARVDITPPPGPSTFGHGPDARASNGYWTRLYCRVFVLQTEPTPPLALAACDLGAVSVLLHRKVAELVLPVIPPTRLIITATHTHAGPAHFFEGPAYGGVTSSRLPGFDPAMLQFLAERIAQGVRSAAAHLTPARARWVHAQAWGLSRNRDLDPYRANPKAYAPALPPSLAPRLGESERAIDPDLNVLQLEQIDASNPDHVLGPFGWIILFAMHPTVMPAATRIFNADLFGIASRALEGEMRRQRNSAASVLGPTDPIAAIINSNEGDVSPIWQEGTAQETERKGIEFANRIWATREASDPWRRQIHLDSRYLEVDLPAAPMSNAAALCPEPMLGQAANHGASDHPSSLDGLLASEGDLDLRPGRCHSPKKQLLGRLQPLLIGTEGFPSHVPLSLARIDDTWLSFIPAELTITAGHMVDDAVLRQARVEDHRPAHAVVAGLANGYIQYVTTEAEYRLQHYEGASTLYGPSVAAFLAERFELLASTMRQDLLAKGWSPLPALGQVQPFQYQTAPERSRLPTVEDEPGLGELAHLRGQRFLCSIQTEPSPTLCMSWRDGAPGRVALTQAPWLRVVLDEPARTAARTCGRYHLGGSAGNRPCDTSATLDDRGAAFQVRVTGRGDGLYRDAYSWCTVLHPTALEWEALADQGSLRIQVGDLLSSVFSARNLPPRCEPWMLRDCLEP